ncbi:MAG: hypothetical protein ACKVTZ_04160 [Bacteroidia bacterium]
MNTLINKSWQYTLSEQKEKLILSVVCGSVGIYTVTFELSEEEHRLYEEKGEKYADELATQVVNQPELFLPRNIAEEENIQEEGFGE